MQIVSLDDFFVVGVYIGDWDKHGVKKVICREELPLKDFWLDFGLIVN